MNFYAHALVAEQSSPRVDFVLGAMLPDLAAMAGLRIERVDTAPLAEGVAFHHRCDAAFHTSAGFGALVREGSRSLRGRGLGRGPALAAAHVGIELLLDGGLAVRGPLAKGYAAALARAPERAGAVSWRGSEPASPSLARVCDALPVHGVPARYDDADFAASRVARVLARRPRLALAAGDEHHVAAWLHAVRPRVVDAAPEWIAEVERAVG